MRTRSGACWQCLVGCVPQKAGRALKGAACEVVRELAHAIGCILACLQAGGGWRLVGNREVCGAARGGAAWAAPGKHSQVNRANAVTDMLPLLAATRESAMVERPVVDFAEL